MKIAVLDLTTHPKELLGSKPRVYEQLIAWLSQALPEADYLAYDIAEGGKALPDVSDFDGLLVSGSEYGVYDNLPWMQPLRDLLLATKAAGKPVYGICFGHQIMADTFGGKAEKAKVGNYIGACKFTEYAGTEGANTQGTGKQYDAHVWHQDQVTIVPPGAQVTASASHCPVGALQYDFPAASVQFHPEYREAHLRELFDIFRGTAVPENLYRQALDSFETSSVAVDLKAREAADFFRQHIPVAAVPA